MNLSKILKTICEADTNGTDMDLSSDIEYDFGHVPKKETTSTEEPAAPVENIPTEEEETPEDVVPEETKTSRLLSMDKNKANLELKELCAIPQPAIPLSKIKEILKNYKLQFADSEIKFIGRSSNKDFGIVNDKGVAISNSQLVIYWNRESENSFVVNVYLS
jgi:hypothetical protein